MTGAANGMPTTIAGAASYYVRLGLCPIPLPHDSDKPGKRPIIDGWPSLRPTEADIPVLFPRNGADLNLGILLGEPAGGVVDVDIDCDEALAVANAFLPDTTWISGRKSALRSHRWYQVSAPPDKADLKFIDPVLAATPDRAVVIELRSTGAQTVVPPSLHIKTRECLEWHRRDGERPTPVDIQDLERAVRCTAAAALLTRYWPRKGAKHDGRLFLAGVLTRANWAEEEVANFITAVATAAGDQDLRDCESVTRSTAEKHLKGEKYAGWPSLATVLTCGKTFAGEVIDTVREWLGITGDGDSPAVAPPPPRPWPERLADEAFHGLAGDIVRALDPATEADPAAILVQTLLAFGNQCGRDAYFQVEGTRHHVNEFAVLIGRTSKGRKGTSWDRVAALVRRAEEQWATERVQSGLSSGEGLIWAVRDPIEKNERVKEKGEVRYEKVVVDEGIADKRILVLEPEFCNVLKQTERQGNTLSAILRNAWDGKNLKAMTKNSPAQATGAHVSLVGHITAEELARSLSATESANGFGNRFLWICVQRSKLLPDGADLDEEILDALARRLGDALVFARQTEKVTRTEEARALWHSIYGDLSEGRPGLAGALLGRAEAHVMRLAMIYTLLDCSPVIDTCHLMAALAVWEYAEASVVHVFGDSLGDPIADELLRLLRAAPNGMSRTDMIQAFGRNQSADRIGKALALLAGHKLAWCESKPTGGRPQERWNATKLGT